MCNSQKCTSSCLCFLSALLKFPFFSCNTPSVSGEDLSACRSGCLSATTNMQRHKAVTPSSSSLLMTAHPHADKLDTGTSLTARYGGSVERKGWFIYMCVCVYARVCISAELEVVNAFVICQRGPAVCS